MPPKGYRKNAVAHLQANDTMEYAPKPAMIGLTDEQIEEALQPYKASGVRLELTDTHWLLTLKKDVRDIKGRVIGSGDVKVTGTRQMPIKDFLYSISELLIPITPLTV